MPTTANIDPVSLRAAEWLARRTDAPLSAAEEADFRAWLAADPAHATAYGEMLRLWDNAGPAMDLRDARAVPRVSRSKWAMASSFAVAVLGAAWAFAETHPFADYRTDAGELRTVSLPDGSTMQLSTATRISLDYTAETRSIVLHDGEAFFTVAPAPDRPFVVRAGATKVTSLGTAFSVASRDAQGAVVVTEHSVAVEQGGRRTDVGEGQRIEFGAKGLTAVRATDAGSDLAWRSGQLVFMSQPFDRVVDELARWRSGRAIVTDAGLAKRTVTVIVDVRREGDPLDAVKGALGIETTALTPYLTLIRSTR